MKRLFILILCVAFVATAIVPAFAKFTPREGGRTVGAGVVTSLQRESASGVLAKVNPARSAGMLVLRRESLERKAAIAQKAGAREVALLEARVDKKVEHIDKMIALKGAESKKVEKELAALNATKEAKIAIIEKESLLAREAITTVKDKLGIVREVYAAPTISDVLQKKFVIGDIGRIANELSITASKQLALQVKVQQGQGNNTISNMQKARHDSMMATIQNIR